MRKLLLATALFTAGFGIAAQAAEIDVERERVNGKWRIRCSAVRPAEPEAVAEVGEELRRRCKREADTLASKQHTTSGSLLRAQVGPVQTDEKKTVLTVTVKLVAG